MAHVADAQEMPESISWRVRLSDKAPKKLYVLAFCALLALVIGTISFGLLLGALGFAIILGSTAEFWWGTAYRLDPKGASARNVASVTAIAWDDVKRVVFAGDGVKLSPLAEPGRMGPFRGVYLRYGALGRERIESAVRRVCKDDVRFVEGGAD